MSYYLTIEQLHCAVAAIAKALDQLNIDYAVMGGAAVCIMGSDPQRTTEDVDLVIRVDERNITADKATDLLLKSSDDFIYVSQYGHVIPAYRLVIGDVERLVQMEIFDLPSWPRRPQYDLTTATRRNITLQGHEVKFFSPEWIFREKVCSGHQRGGSTKGMQDVRDVVRMLRLADPSAPEMDFTGSEELAEALKFFLSKRPDAQSLVRQKVKCDAILN